MCLECVLPFNNMVDEGPMPKQHNLKPLPDRERSYARRRSEFLQDPPYHGAYWKADGGVMPARLSTRTAVDGSDGDGVCYQVGTTSV